MVGGFPAAAPRQVDLVRGRINILHGFRGRPDMVQASPPIGRSPIFCAVTPPGKKSLVVRHGEARNILKTPLFARRLQARRFLRRVGDDLEHLFVRPDVILMWGNVEIANQNARRPIELLVGRSQSFQKVELVREFRI